MEDRRSRAAGARRLLLIGLFAVGVLASASFLASVALAITDDDLTWLDLVRTAVILLSVIVVGTQALSLLGVIGPSKLLGTLFRGLRRLFPGGAVAAAAVSPPPLLDGATLAELRRLAPPGLGVRGGWRPNLRAGRERLEAFAWFGLLFAVIIIVAFGAVLLAYFTGTEVADGNTAMPVPLTGGLSIVALGALAFLLRVAVASLRNGSRRDFKRYLLRFLRFLLRKLDQAAGRAGSAVRTVGQTVIGNATGLAAAVTVVAAVAFSPVLADAIDSGSGGGTVLAITPSATALEADETPRPTPTAISTSQPPGSRTASSSPTPTPTPDIYSNVTATPVAPTPIRPTAAPVTAPPVTPAPTDILITPPPAPCVLDQGVPERTGSVYNLADMAQELTDLTNQYRKQNGLAGFDYNGSLAGAANQHSTFILQTHWWELYGGRYEIHCDADGHDQYDRAVAHGYPPNLVAENVAWGYIGRPASAIFQDMLQGEEPADSRLVNMAIVCVGRSDTNEYSCTQVMAGQ